ncbi:hypothetical protein [Streptomyces sp. NRRL F-5123]|uniref:hypothetical protein n=1 Tax=Streptomyces sp. NRRL F-5123 TaxID=1463856 RepID=UPI0004E17091|nr:hypothetical protein [Streptomyces sp. NRRL F-5123]
MKLGQPHRAADIEHLAEGRQQEHGPGIPAHPHVDVGQLPREARRRALVRGPGQQHHVNALPTDGPQEGGSRTRPRPLLAVPQHERQALRDRLPREVAQQYGVGRPRAHPAGAEPARGGVPQLRGLRRAVGGTGARPAAQLLRRAREPHRAQRSAVHGLREIGQKAPCRPGGVGNLLGQLLQPHDLVRGRAARRPQFLGRHQLTGLPRVDQVRTDAGAAQQPPYRLVRAQLAAPGQVACRGAVRFQAQQRRAPAAYREAGGAVEERGVRRGGTRQPCLEGAEAEVRGVHPVAVRVHQVPGHPPPPSPPACPSGPRHGPFGK